MNLVEKLKFTGWKWQDFGILESPVYILPGGKNPSDKASVRMVDYVAGDRDITKFCVQHFGWKPQQEKVRECCGECCGERSEL